MAIKMQKEDEILRDKGCLYLFFVDFIFHKQINTGR